MIDAKIGPNMRLSIKRDGEKELLALVCGNCFKSGGTYKSELNIEKYLYDSFFNIMNVKTQY